MKFRIGQKVNFDMNKMIDSSLDGNANGIIIGFVEVTAANGALADNGVKNTQFIHGGSVIVETLYYGPLWYDRSVFVVGNHMLLRGWI